MDKLKLLFRQCGLYTTIQDGGRIGYQSLGVPQSGPLDKNSAIYANQLVGNHNDQPVLEITLQGPEIEFSKTCTIALCGADLSAQVNGQKVELNNQLIIERNDVLTFGRPIKGTRTYLAVSGKWNVKKWLGSASPAPIDSDKLTPNSKIKKRSVVEILQSKAKTLYPKIDKKPIEHGQIIEVMKGPEYSLLKKNEITQLINSELEISVDSNRMGYRLKNKIKGFSSTPEMISSGIIPGTVQLTSKGNPIILLADAQTIGGYPRILVVKQHSLDKLGQLKPGEKLKFKLK